MKNFLRIGFISLIAFQCQNPIQSDIKELPSEVVEVIQKRISNGVTPSVAIALIDSSGTYYFNFGKTEKGGKYVDENTIYEIGSISKVFTGVLLAQQILDGDLSMDDEINELLPDSIRVPFIGETEITIGSLTDHTSGLPRMPNNFTPANPNNPYADYSINQMYQFISSYQPTREVGSEYEYSNLAQGLLGHLLAKHKNMSYEKLMIQVIADPLEMYDTRIEFTEGMKENLALGHSGGKVVENWDIPTLAGAGAIRSSTIDMARFISANLGYINIPVTDAMKLSHKVRHDKAGTMSVAMAWHIKKGANGDVIWHNGGTGGYRAFTGFVKDTGKGVVLLTNSSYSSDDIGFHLLDPESELANHKFKEDAVDLEENIISKYVGVYELQSDFTITISKVGKQLYGQGTGQDKFKIYAENDTLFFINGDAAKLSFRIKDNTVKSLVLLQGGQKTNAMKIE